jgi:hypothetical protein
MRCPVITLIVLLEPNHGLHVHSMDKGTSLHIRKVKEITIVSDNDSGPDLLDVSKEAAKEGCLIGFIEDGEEAWVIGLGCVFKVFNVLTHNIPVGDQEALKNQPMYQGQFIHVR